MGNQTHKKVKGGKGVGVDFKRVKRKVGRKLPRPENETKTSFKAKRITLPEQSLGRGAQDDGAGALAGIPGSEAKEQQLQQQQQLQQSLRRTKPLKELFSLLTHHSDKARCEALVGLQALLSRNPAELARHVRDVFEHVGPKLCDADAKVRGAAYDLLQSVVFPGMANEVLMAPFFPTLMAHLCCAMTHLVAPVRFAALPCLDAVVARYPSLVQPYHGQILDHFADLLSRKGPTAQSSAAIAPVLISLLRLCSSSSTPPHASTSQKQQQQQQQQHLQLAPEGEVAEATDKEPFLSPRIAVAEHCWGRGRHAAGGVGRLPPNPWFPVGVVWGSSGQSRAFSATSAASTPTSSPTPASHHGDAEAAASALTLLRESPLLALVIKAATQRMSSLRDPTGPDPSALSCVASALRIFVLCCSSSTLAAESLLLQAQQRQQHGPTVAGQVHRLLKRAAFPLTAPASRHGAEAKASLEGLAEINVLLFQLLVLQRQVRLAALVVAERTTEVLGPKDEESAEAKEAEGTPHGGGDERNDSERGELYGASKDSLEEIWEVSAVEREEEERGDGRRGRKKRRKNSDSGKDIRDAVQRNLEHGRNNSDRWRQQQEQQQRKQPQLQPQQQQQHERQVEERAELEEEEWCLVHYFEGALQGQLVPPAALAATRQPPLRSSAPEATEASAAAASPARRAGTSSALDATATANGIRAHNLLLTLPRLLPSVSTDNQHSLLTAFTSLFRSSPSTSRAKAMCVDIIGNLIFGRSRSNSSSSSSSSSSNVGGSQSYIFADLNEVCDGDANSPAFSEAALLPFAAAASRATGTASFCSVPDDIIGDWVASLPRLLWELGSKEPSLSFAILNIIHQLLCTASDDSIKANAHLSSLQTLLIPFFCAPLPSPPSGPPKRKKQQKQLAQKVQDEEQQQQQQQQQQKQLLLFGPFLRLPRRVQWRALDCISLLPSLSRETLRFLALCCLAAPSDCHSSSGIGGHSSSTCIPSSSSNSSITSDPSPHRTTFATNTSSTVTSSRSGGSSVFGRGSDGSGSLREAVGGSGTSCLSERAVEAVAVVHGRGGVDTADYLSFLLSIVLGCTRDVDRASLSRYRLELERERRSDEGRGTTRTEGRKDDERQKKREVQGEEGEVEEGNMEEEDGRWASGAVGAACAALASVGDSRVILDVLTSALTSALDPWPGASVVCAILRLLAVCAYQRPLHRQREHRPLSNPISPSAPRATTVAEAAGMGTEGTASEAVASDAGSWVAGMPEGLRGVVVGSLVRLLFTRTTKLVSRLQLSAKAAAVQLSAADVAAYLQRQPWWQLTSDVLLLYRQQLLSDVINRVIASFSNPGSTDVSGANSSSTASTAWACDRSMHRFDMATSAALCLCTWTHMPRLQLLLTRLEPPPYDAAAPNGQSRSLLSHAVRQLEAAAADAPMQWRLWLASLVESLSARASHLLGQAI